MNLRNPMRAVSLISAASLAGLAVAQDGEVAATYEVRGETRQISNTELGLEIARRERLRPRGQEALAHLVDKTLVADAAAAAGLAPTRDDIDAYVRDLGERLESHGLDLAKFLSEKNLTRDAFEESYVSLSIAHERLVMKSAGLRSRAEITNELLALWLEEARQKRGVITDADKLGAGFVARIGDKNLTLADLGDVLLQNASRSTRDRAVRQIVVRELLHAEATRLGLTVSPDEIQHEILRRRKLIESDPRYRGASYEELLKAQGTSVKALRESPVIRAQVQRRKIIDAELPHAVVKEKLNKERRDVLLRHGPKRKINVILVRATERPNQLVPLDFAAAKERVEAVRERLDDGMAFATAARIHSDDPTSKVKGGDVGKHALMSKSLPRAVLDAAYHLDPFVVSEPVRTEQGFYLVMVSKIDPAPTDAQLLVRLREELAMEYVRDLVQSAKIELIDP